MKKSILLLLIVYLFVVNTNFESANADSTSPVLFSDISTHWAKETIVQAVNSGYVLGYPDGSFQPDKNVTRAEFIKLIVGSMKLSVTNETYSNWYDPYVTAANDAGIYVEGDFVKGDMNTAMNRYEMSRAASRAIDIKYADHKEWMYVATNNGLILGMDKTGTLGQDQNTTRAQSITVIERILTINAGGNLKVDKHAVNRAEVLWHGTNAFSMMEYVIGKSDPRWDQIQATLKTFNPANMSIETPAGLPKVKKVVDAILWIDLDDPEDPYRHLIPEDAKIFPYAEGVEKTFYLKNYKNAFAIVSQGRELVNEDKKAYPFNDKVFLEYSPGVELDFSRMAKGDIKGQGTLKLYYDHMSEANDAVVLLKDFKYFPTIKSTIIAKPPTKTYQKDIFKLALWKN
jgi:hypothetical protein